MFSGRLPDHLLQAGTVLDEVAAFEAIVEDKEPLKTILTQLHTTKLDLTSAQNKSQRVLGSASHTTALPIC